MTAQKGTKDFETHLLNLALLSKGKVLFKDEGINIIKSNEKFNGIKENHISSVVDAVIHLNTKFNKTWTDGYNANFEDIPEPSYGTKSAKSDIVLISGKEYFGFSVKMDEDWVVASAQNKNEFEGIFFSALMKYEEDNSIDTSSLIPYVESISNVIGKVVVRHMNPNHFDKKKDGIHDEWIDRLSEEIYKNNKIIEDENSIVRNSTKKKSKLLELEINKFPNLMNYIVHEALTSNLKYNGKLPSAEYVLCPTGCYDIRDRNSKFVVAVAKIARMSIRGMCHGLMRSSATSAIKRFWNSDTNMKFVYDTINKMDMSLKWDIRKIELVEVL